MSYLESVLKKLATGDPSRHLEPFPREALPNDRNDQLWETIRAEYRLTLPELSSLKNSVFGTPEGAGGLPAVQETKAKSNRPIKVFCFNTFHFFSRFCFMSSSFL